MNTQQFFNGKSYHPAPGIMPEALEFETTDGRVMADVDEVKKHLVNAPLFKPGQTCSEHLVEFTQYLGSLAKNRIAALDRIPVDDSVVSLRPHTSTLAAFLPQREANFKLCLLAASTKERIPCLPDGACMDSTGMLEFSFEAEDGKIYILVEASGEQAVFRLAGRGALLKIGEGDPGMILNVMFDEDGYTEVVLEDTSEIRTMVHHLQIFLDNQ